MNTDFNEGEMMDLGVSYAVNDDMTANVGMTTYGDVAFSMAGTNMSGGLAGSGQLGYLNANDEDLSIGVTYTMAGVNLGATMHMITNTENEAHERDVMEISLAYSLNDNSSLGVKYATDATGDDETKYTWLTLTVRP